MEDSCIPHLNHPRRWYCQIPVSPYFESSKKVILADSCIPHLNHPGRWYCQIPVSPIESSRKVILPDSCIPLWIIQEGDIARFLYPPLNHPRRWYWQIPVSPIWIIQEGDIGRFLYPPFESSRKVILPDSCIPHLNHPRRGYCQIPVSPFWIIQEGDIARFLYPPLNHPGRWYCQILFDPSKEATFWTLLWGVFLLFFCRTPLEDRFQVCAARPGGEWERESPKQLATWKTADVETIRRCAALPGCLHLAQPHATLWYT